MRRGSWVLFFELPDVSKRSEYSDFHDSINHVIYYLELSYNHSQII